MTEKRIKVEKPIEEDELFESEDLVVTADLKKEAQEKIFPRFDINHRQFGSPTSITCKLMVTRTNS